MPDHYTFSIKEVLAGAVTLCVLVVGTVLFIADTRKEVAYIASRQLAHEQVSEEWKNRIVYIEQRINSLVEDIDEAEMDCCVSFDARLQSFIERSRILFDGCRREIGEVKKATR